jgi:N6-adenosine-specific RNA methylase IME4
MTLQRCPLRRSRMTMRTCSCGLWSTRKVFREGQAAEVARAWGFEPVGEIIWGLPNPGFGQVLGNDHEPCLIARRGKGRLTRGVRLVGVHFWRQTYADGGKGKAHSAKPEAFLDLVESISPGPYLELFARRHRLGWDVWGNESANTATLVTS